MTGIKTKYSVIIPSTNKDYNKVKYVVKSIRRFVSPQPEEILVICSDDNINLDISNIKVILETDILPFDKNLANNFRRPAWIYQQFLKLFNFLYDQYMVVDSDLIFNKPFHVFSKDNKKQFFLGNDQNHKPYFMYTQDFFGFGREYNHSFISEVMLMESSKCRELIDIYSSIKNKPATVSSLYEETCKVVNNDFLIGDYEVYGNFVYKYYKEEYNIVKLQSNLKGKYGIWSNEELEHYIDEMSSQTHHLITAHSWI